MMSIKVGICVAYDWEMLRHSLPLVYDYADVICLSIDENQVSWAGKRYELNRSQFQSLIKSIDSQKKIKMLEESFYQPGLSPMQNEVGQRNRMANFMGTGGWHVQLDCDEYFSEFNQFVTFLKSIGDKDRSINICCIWVTLFKKVQGGFLVVDPENQIRIESIPVATTKPNYQFGRRNGDFNFQTNFQLLHQSWAREESEVLQKITNWGHSNDFNLNKFVSFWKRLDHTNFDQARDFHPIDPSQWPSLKFIEASSIEEVINKIKSKKISNYSKLDLALKNSRIISKVKSMLK